MARLSATELKLLQAASKLVDRGVAVREAAEALNVTYYQLQGFRKSNAMVARRVVFTIPEKVAAVERVRSGEKLEAVALDIGAAVISMQRWSRAYNAGMFTFENAVAVRRTEVASKAAPTEHYVIDGQKFATIDECKKYAVEKLGGITLTRTITETINL